MSYVYGLRVIMQLLRESFEAVRRRNPCMGYTFDIFARCLAYIQHGRQVSKLRVKNAKR